MTRPLASRMSGLTRWVGLSLGLPGVALGLMLSQPATAMASGFTVWVPPPNGVNDTANIQGALNACVAHGPGCTVRLHSGKYLTTQLLVNDFHGTVVGASADATFVQALPNYVVGPNIFSSPPSATNPYPFVLSFGGVSDVTMSGLTFRVTEFNPTTGWIYHVPVTWLKGFIYVQGSGRFTGMSFIGAAGTDAYPPYPGVNVDNSVLVMSTIPGGGSTGPSRFEMTRNLIVNDGNGFELGYFSGRATIGGSPSGGNVFRNSAGGVYYHLDGATVEESYNRIEDSVAGYYDVTFVNLASPAVLPRVLLAHNTMATNGAYYMDGIVEINSGLAIAVTDNDIRIGGDGTGEGIGLVATGAGTVIWDNTITGTGIDAVGLYSGTTLAKVIENEVGRFVPGALGFGTQIYLDPYTSNNLVVCREPSSVLDQGTNNIVSGCAAKSEPGSAARAGVIRKPTLPTTRLQLP
jgi:hypothetical protein